MGTRLYVLLGILACVRSDSSPCRQEKNCKLPKCFCSTFNHTLLPVSEIPQMVYFGFDDALTPPITKIYKRLFRADRVNPNGCRIGMTLYVSDTYTSYSEVKWFYDEGMEIASHSVNHGHIQTRDVLYREAKQQKDNFAIHSHIPRSEITGWRSPFLETAGDVQPDVLKSLGYEYDISLTFNRGSYYNPVPWPFTADYGWPFQCQMKPCLKGSHPGFWEFPVNTMIDFKGSYPCNYLDGCMNRPSNEHEAFQYLMNNFNSAYNGNRAPFGIHAHAAWLETPHNFKAMERFLEELSKKSDVYVLPVNKVLKWMQQPTSLRNLRNFMPWKCKNADLTSSVKSTKSSRATTIKTSRRTEPTTTTIRTTTTETTTRTDPPTTVLKTTPTTVLKTTPTISKTSVTKTTSSNRASTDSLWGFSIFLSSFHYNRDHTEVTSNSKTTTTANVAHIGTKYTVNQNQAEPFTIKPATSGASRNYFGWSWNFVKLFSELNPPHILRVKPKLSLISGHGTNDNCVQGKNCKIPNCFCKGSSISDGSNNEETPQFVHISFDGNIDSQVFYKYRSLFSGQRKNPDDCPISSTFFVTQERSRDMFLSYLYNNSQEIALRGYTASNGGSVYRMGKQLEEQVETLLKLGIKTFGWRSPDLKPLGDKQFSILTDKNMMYDSTLVYQDVGTEKAWPYTLDYGWRESCVISECPKGYYPGLWEVPNVPLMDYKNMYPCNYVDGCMFSPQTAEETFQFLWDNFQRHYKSNKAPFGLSFRHIWFTHPSYRNNLKGFIMFLDKILEFDDVYVTSIKNVIKWMKNPLSVSEMLLRSQC